MRKSFGLILDHSKDVLIFFYCRSFLACKNFEVCLHDSKRSSQLMSGTGRKLLLCCKRIIQSGKHLIKRACKTRNLIVCIWNFKRLRKILGLYFIDFVTESSQRQQCTAADKICTDTAQENNDCSCNDTSGAEKVFGFLYLIGKTCKQSVWINVKGDWRGISFIDLYDIITQIPVTAELLIKKYIKTQVTVIRSVMISVSLHCRESFFRGFFVVCSFFISDPP